MHTDTHKTFSSKPLQVRRCVKKSALRSVRRQSRRECTAWNPSTRNSKSACNTLKTSRISQRSILLTTPPHPGRRDSGWPRTLFLSLPPECSHYRCTPASLAPFGSLTEEIVLILPCHFSIYNTTLVHPQPWSLPIQSCLVLQGLL